MAGIDGVIPLIEWTYYNAADYGTNQKLAERAQIVADALDEGLRVDLQYKSTHSSTGNWFAVSTIVAAAYDEYNIRIGREVPELEVWAQVRNGEVNLTSKNKTNIENFVEADGGECVRFVPERK